MVRAVPSRWIWLLVIASLVLILDQATKFWAVDHLTKATTHPPVTSVQKKLEVFVKKKKLERIRAQSVVIHPDYVRLRYVENPGAAWGMLAGLDDSVRLPFFYVISLVALGFLTALFSRLRQEQRLLAFTFALILGGALGNFIDRLLRGYVIDFIDFHWRLQHHFPTFNVADIAISAGLVGLCLEAIFGRRVLPDEREGSEGVGELGEGEDPDDAPDRGGTEALAEAAALDEVGLEPIAGLSERPEEKLELAAPPEAGEDEGAPPRREGD